MFSWLARAEERVEMSQVERPAAGKLYSKLVWASKSNVVEGIGKEETRRSQARHKSIIEWFPLNTLSTVVPLKDIKLHEV